MVHHSSVWQHHSSALFCTSRQHSSAPFISTVAPFVGTVLHHSSTWFCTICLFSSAPFVSSVLHHSSVQFCTIRLLLICTIVCSVLHHSLATIMRHVIMLIYNSASTNNLANDANALCRLHHKLLVLATAAYRTFRPTCRRIYSAVEIQLHYTSVKSMFFCPAAELLVNSVYYRRLIVDLRAAPFIWCISTVLYLNFCIRLLSTITISIYL